MYFGSLDSANLESGLVVDVVQHFLIYNWFASTFTTVKVCLGESLRCWIFSFISQEYLCSLLPEKGRLSFYIYGKFPASPHEFSSFICMKSRKWHIVGLNCCPKFCLFSLLLYYCIGYKLYLLCFKAEILLGLVLFIRGARVVLVYDFFVSLWIRILGLLQWRHEEVFESALNSLYTIFSHAIAGSVTSQHLLNKKKAKK